jgi:outer membrane cobalamin receptor
VTFKLLPTKRQTITANVSLIDSINDSDVLAFQDKKLPGYYRKSFVLRYGYSLKQWLYSFEADIKRDVFYDRANLLKGDDVNLLNAGIRYLFKQSNIDFRVNNLLDENIQYFRNRPTPGLNVSLTYNHAF